MGGWIDPTNNKRPDSQYTTTAWGRDYGEDSGRAVWYMVVESIR
jgi:hypothetical protein